MEGRGGGGAVGEEGEQFGYFDETSWPYHCQLAMSVSIRSRS